MLLTTVYLSGLVAVCAATVIFARSLWHAREARDGGDAVWGSALADELPPMQLPSRPVERLRLRLAPAPVVAIVDGELAPVRHEGASESDPEEGAIGTIAHVRPSDDLLTFAEQVRGSDDDWAGFDQALVDYENAMLRNAMVGPGVARESTQQRIDRWLREGGVGVQHARSEVRQAVSETWDSPSRELPLVDRPDVERVVEAVLTA